MQYVSFGRTGLRTSEICLGTLRFGDGKDGIGAAASRAVFDAFVEQGGNFLDTANVYNGGESERMLGELIRAERDHLIVATKYCMSRPGDNIVAAGASRKNLRLSIEGSLRRLGTDHVDILYLHQWDFDTAEDEVLRALDDLVHQGKIGHIGLSNAPAWIVARCETLCEVFGWNRIAGLQIPYSLAERTAEREVLPMAQALKLGLTAWWPLGGGLLAGGIAQSQTERERHIAQAVAETAAELGVSAARVALAWIRRHAELEIIPIVGADDPAQVADNIAAAELELTDGHRERLDAASRIDLGYPYEYLLRDSFRNMRTAYQPDRLRPAR